MNRVLDWWFAPIRPARLRTFERAFALSFILYMAAWLHGASEWLTTAGFHYPIPISDKAFSSPLPPLPPSMLIPFVIALLGAPLLVVIGRWRQPALLVCLACAFYIQRVDTYSAFTINKLFIVGFLVLFLAPSPVRVDGPDPAEANRRISPLAWLIAVLAGGAYAIWARPDSGRPMTDHQVYGLIFGAVVVGLIALMAATWRRRPPAVRRGDLFQSAWPVRVLQATLIIQYGTAGICKIAHGDWMGFPGEWFAMVDGWPSWQGGSVTFKGDILVGHSVGLYRTEIAAWLVGILPHWAWVVQGVLALAFELFAPVLFMVRRLRPLAYFIGVNMHLIIALMMVDLIWFSLQMVTFYILFMNDDRLMRFEGWLQSRALPGKR